MTKLSVNINKVALLRNSRHGTQPDPLRAAVAALEAGAEGITVHPRPDQRHIRPDDALRCATLLQEERWADREYNIEGNPLTGDWMTIVKQARPDQATLVPDDPGQFTSDHGWSITPNLDKLKTIIAQLHEAGCRVSLFMDPDLAEIEKVPQTGADRIELYTESFAVAHEQGGDALEKSWQQFHDAAQAAHQLGLGVNAGHDLNLHNLARFCRIPHIAEVSIGHALIGDAILMGMDATVAAYLTLIEMGNADQPSSVRRSVSEQG